MTKRMVSITEFSHRRSRMHRVGTSSPAWLPASATASNASRTVVQFAGSHTFLVSSIGFDGAGAGPVWMLKRESSHQMRVAPDLELIGPRGVPDGRKR